MKNQPFIEKIKFNLFREWLLLIYGKNWNQIRNIYNIFFFINYYIQFGLEVNEAF